MGILRIARSVFFVPGNNWKMIQKAKTENPDVIILDLEDAVPTDDKETARWFVKSAIPVLKQAGHKTFVRVNGITTGLTAEDLRFVVQPGLDGIMLPKVEHKHDIQTLVELIKVEEERKMLTELAVFPIIETVDGVLNALEIATSTKRIVALSFGAGDLMRDIGRINLELSRDQLEILYARSRVVLAAASAGVPAIDIVFFGSIIDLDGLIAESNIAAQLGFKGKMIIHPLHIEPVNRVFSPSESEIEKAEELVRTYEQALAAGSGASLLRGKMIDYMNYEASKNLLEIADAVSRKNRKILVRREAGACTDSPDSNASES